VSATVANVNTEGPKSRTIRATSRRDSEIVSSALLKTQVIHG
jgi:hypothetical protein